MSFDPLRKLKTVNPTLYKRMQETSETAFSNGKIPVKYKFLIAMALDACEGAENGVTSLAAQAIEQGATKEEIAEVLEVLHFVCGGGSIYTASIGLSKIEEL